MRFSSGGMTGRKRGTSIVLPPLVTLRALRSPTAVHSQALYTFNSGCSFLRMASIKSSTIKKSPPPCPAFSCSGVAFLYFPGS